MYVFYFFGYVIKKVEIYAFYSARQWIEPFM